MTPFNQFLESEGFQADACESTIHPDFYRLAEKLWTERNQAEHMASGAICLGAKRTMQLEQSQLALIEARDVLGLCKTKPWYPKNTPEFGPVRSLCEAYGYGAVIACASSQWMEMLASKGYPAGGAHTAGPCASTVEATIGAINRAICS